MAMARPSSTTATRSTASSTASVAPGFSASKSASGRSDSWRSVPSALSGTSRTGCPTRRATPVATSPIRACGPLGVETDGKVGVDPGRPQHVLEVAQRHVREVQPQEVHTQRGQAAQHRRAQRGRPQGDDKPRRPFLLRHVPIPSANRRL